MFNEECIYCAGPRPTVKGRWDSEYCRSLWIERRLAYIDSTRSGEFNNMSEDCIPLVQDLIENVWTLQEYIDWINRPEEGVIKGELMAAEEWKVYDITTASQLGDYLDGCYRREVEKAERRGF
jgi:hypothetical protein